MSRPWMQWLLIPAVTLALFLVWDFSQRAATLARLTDMEQLKQQQLARAHATQVALVEGKKDAQSDDRVKKIARGLGYADPNDMVVRTPPTPTAIPIPQTRPAPAPAKNWLDLLLEFLGLK